MLWKTDEIITIPLNDGIVIDYMEDRFVLIVKDTFWSNHECHALIHNPLHIYFVYERICALFLLENVDSIDTSDAVFDIHNCDEAESLLQKERYDLELYLIDKTQRICATRRISFTQRDSAIIRIYLQMQMDTPYDDDGFDHALTKLQGMYEPFEMEKMAKVKSVF